MKHEIESKLPNITEIYRNIDAFFNKIESKLRNITETYRNINEFYIKAAAESGIVDGTPNGTHFKPQVLNQVLECRKGTQLNKR